MDFQRGCISEVIAEDDTLLVHISSDHSCYDSGTAKNLQRWPIFEETFDGWKEQGQSLGDVRVIDLEPGLRLAIIIGQVYAHPNYVTSVDAVASGFTVLTDQIRPSTKVHAMRVGGLHHPKAIWTAMEAGLRSLKACSVTVHDHYLRAIGDGDLEAVKSLVANGASLDGSIEGLDWEEGSDVPIILAVTDPRKCEHIVRYMIDEKVFLPDRVLESTMVGNRMYGMLDWLVESLLDQAEPRMMTPDILTCTAHIPYVKRLLDNGASATAVSSSGTTPLHMAARMGTVPLMEILIEHGAAADLKNLAGQTPLDFAKSWNKKKNVSFLKKHLGIPNRTKKETEAHIEKELFADACAIVRADGFDALVVDHDETLASARRRMKRVEKKLGAA